MEQSEKNINPKYINMVNRFKQIPVDRKNFKTMLNRFKLMEKFEIWYKNHVDELTSEEREYLQANIKPVSTYLDYIDEEPKTKDPWGELEAF
jgi:hypothetical protein